MPGESLEIHQKIQESNSQITDFWWDIIGSKNLRPGDKSEDQKTVKIIYRLHLRPAFWNIPDQHRNSLPHWSMKNGLIKRLKIHYAKLAHNRLDETSIVDRHRCHMPAKFGLFVDEDQSKFPTLYWLPKLHKRPYKSRFIANSSACTTTELSILLTSCLTAIKNPIIKYCTTVYERNGKKYFGLLKIQVKFLIN